MAAAPGAARAGDWQCPNTECINHQEFPTRFVFGCKVNCPKCGTGKSAQRAGDWCCPNPNCVNHQNTVYGSKMQCQRCGAARPPLNARGGGIANESPSLVGAGFGGGKGPGGVPLPRPGDWHCPNPSCKNHTDNLVFANKANCPICGTDKPAPPAGMPAHMPMMPQQGGFGGRPVRGKPGDWHCPNPECKNHTENTVYGSKAHCPICATPKPANAKEWSGAGAGGFGAGPRGQPPPPPPPPFGKGGGKGCFGGGGFGGGFGGGGGGGCFGGGKGPGGVPLPRPGDWHCPNPSCKNHTDNLVFANKSSCPVCGTSKPAGGGGGAITPIMPSSAPGSSGRPGDWQCPNVSCKNHLNGVYASKSHCTICGMPNPNQDRERSRSPRLS